MKSSKNIRKYGNSERKNGKRSEKAAKLDRKSSRGMIYENEELRLRTININAEVERGQTDIKRLRKENDQLRREIWSLRDEYDRLNKKFKTKFVEPDHGGHNARCSQAGCPCQYNDGGCDGGHSRCNSEDSDSCDSCCCHEDGDLSCNEDCCTDAKPRSESPVDQQQSPNNLSPIDFTKAPANSGAISPQPPGPSILTNFDHLSVVSEETLSNSEVQPHQTENLLGYTPDLSGSQTTLPSLVGPLTPLTPIELVANQLNDLQAVVPPLSYFENILHQHMNSSTPGTSSSTSTGKTVLRHTNGWDYNLQSPFNQKCYQANSISPVMRQRSTAQKLTTFVPTTTVTPPPPEDIPTTNGKLGPAESITASRAAALVETVPITTVPVNGFAGQPITAATGGGGANNAATATTNDVNGSANASAEPRHFFAPIKPKLKLNTALANQKRMPPPPPPPSQAVANASSTAFANGVRKKCEPPDIYVTNALATPYKHPVKPTAQPPPVPQRVTSTATTAQTDSANLESILNDIEAISEDILAIQLEKTKSRENLDKKASSDAVQKSQQPLPEGSKNSKPYRSEMNLLLTYDGDNPTIKQALPIANGKQKDHIEPTDTVCSTARRTRSLEREHTDSPSPHIPDPMQPFPDDRKYIGFEHLNQVVTLASAPLVAATGTQTSPVLHMPPSCRPHLPLSPLVTNVNMPKQANSGKPHPPAPPSRSFSSPMSIKCAGIQRSSSVTGKGSANQSPTGSPILGGVHPNKSQLYSAIANAAARRAQFRAHSTAVTRSLDTELIDDGAVEASSQPTKDDRDTTDSIKRKARRVSIVCADTDDPGSPSENPIADMRALPPQNPTTASCSDLHAVMPNPALRNLKQTSHSTPNSPHSSRKHEGSPAATPTPPIVSVTPATPHRGRSVHGNGSQHHHGHSNSYPNAVAASHLQQQRKNSQDTIKASAAEIACAAANAVRSKCSRRHSDGTVSHTNHRSSGASGGTNGGHHHAHHNHHHHQHSSSLVSTTNPHHSHHSHQDSNHETAASYSDRNSSLASSRESSASFSLRSTRRKLSVSSHTGGKIPWCGCWGNGCL